VWRIGPGKDAVGLDASDEGLEDLGPEEGSVGEDAVGLREVEEAEGGHRAVEFGSLDWCGLGGRIRR
jgi:hypothetical protein